MDQTPSTVSALQAYLHAHIPLTRAMQVAVEVADQGRVVLAAPLAPNINHRETVFGGSASALGILAAWTLLYVKLQASGMSARLVIQKNTMAYDAPITGKFSAEAEIADAAAWDRFIGTLARRRRARISVRSRLTCEGMPVGAFAGDFVAIVAAPANPGVA